MSAVQISTSLSHFSPLYHKSPSLMQTTQEVNPHPRIAPCVNMWSVTFSLFYSSSSYTAC
jgi:hypothetical protein